MRRIRTVAYAIAATTFLSVATVSLAADPRETGRECWEDYSFCAVGAGDVTSWRTVCYSDYLICLQAPPVLECLPEDVAACDAARSPCETRNDVYAVGAAFCAEDYDVCLDAHSC